MFQEQFDKLNLQTGDILLFSSNLGIIDRLLKSCTKSKFTHVGIILKDPVYINLKLKGYYLLQSGLEPFEDAEDNKKKYGVQISDLNDVFNEYKNGINGQVFLRRLIIERNNDFYHKIKEIHDIVHNKPYDLDPFDWIIGKLELELNDKIPIKGHIKDKFWCSALASFIYVKLGLLDQNLPWSFIAPNQFSSTDKKELNFLCNLEDDICINIQSV
jgi:hypothetical protein